MTGYSWRDKARIVLDGLKLRKDRDAWKRAALKLLNSLGWGCPPVRGGASWPGCKTCKCPGTEKQKQCALRWAKEVPRD